MNKRRRFKAKRRRAFPYSDWRLFDILPSGRPQSYWIRELATWKEPRVIVKTFNRRNSGGGYDHVTRRADGSRYNVPVQTLRIPTDPGP